MRFTLHAVGILLILNGLIWFFQGINVLPGSFMTGQMKWAVYGVLCSAVGVVVLVVARRMAKKS
jgi:membrane protein implicated in regulation of membrane protease activity